MMKMMMMMMMMMIVVEGLTLINLPVGRPFYSDMERNMLIPFH